MFLVAICLAFTGTPFAQRANDDSRSSQSSGTPNEGIKIHGHWVIDVRNPDGTLTTHREFDNALTSNGAQVLAKLLSRQNKAGRWAILLYANPGNLLLVQEPGSDLPIGLSSETFKTLAVIPQLPPAVQTSSVVLSGNATASVQSTIVAVETQNWLCAPDLTAAECGANNTPGNLLNFTVHPLTPNSQTPPVDLSPGQSVQVKVTISFS